MSFDFTCTGSEDHSLLLYLICGCKMANESLLLSHLSKHFKTIHSNLQRKSLSFFMSEQQTYVANSFKSIMTVSDIAQITSYQV